LGLADRAEFRLADLAGTGLPDQSADALLCVDAFHFASSPLQAALECRRLLKPGGRILITTWQPSSPAAARRLPARIARMDIESDLQSAGFVAIEVLPRPDWSHVETAFWTAASTIDPGDDPALITLRDESLEFLPLADALRRLLVVAATPTV
jgi:SAM-dependent methyltransferase